MKIQEAVLGGVLSVALVIPAFAQSPDASRQGSFGQNVTQPGDAKGNQSGGYQPSLAQKAIMDVQGKLKDKGYFKGNVDGNWGSSSTAALQQYQQANGLQPSGTLDQDTAASLGLSLDEFAAFEAAVDQQPGAQESQPQSPDLQPQTPDQNPDDDSDQRRAL